MDKLERLHQRIVAGDKDAIMDAIYLRIRDVGPAWLSEAFSEAYEAVRALEKRGWDAAFGKPNKGKHLDKSRIKRHWAIPVWNRKKRNQSDLDESVIPHFERTVITELCTAVEKLDVRELREEMWSIINKYAVMAKLEICNGDVHPLVKKLESSQLEQLRIDLRRLLARSMPRNL
jgi:hypothetical protein